MSGKIFSSRSRDENLRNSVHKNNTKLKTMAHKNYILLKRLNNCTNVTIFPDKAFSLGLRKKKRQWKGRKNVCPFSRKDFNGDKISSCV